MSDIKCPICQNNLHKINIVVSTCTNDKCKLWGSSIPNLVLEALTQAKQDLERTRKALEVAKKENEDKQAVLNCVVDMLKTLNKKYTLIMGKDVIKETVRLLEQKDVK